MCNKHIHKMFLESCQMLCSVFEPGIAPYKRTHYNHPCSIWVRTSKENYEWLLAHAYSLFNEHQNINLWVKENFKNMDQKQKNKTRNIYNKNNQHACKPIFDWCLKNYKTLEFSKKGLTDFAQAMPEQYKNIDAVTAYRNYYIEDKSRFAKWYYGREQPFWWPFN